MPVNDCNVKNRHTHKWLLTRPIDISAEERKNMTRFVSALKLQEGKNLGSNQKFAKELSEMHKLVAKFLPCWAVTSLSAKGRKRFVFLAFHQKVR